MKSKEYADRYIKCDYEVADDVLASIVSDIFNEMKAILKARNIKNDQQLIPIVKDTDQKFRKFAMIVNTNPNRAHNIKPTGFLSMLKYKLPNVYDYYIKSSK